MDQRRKDKKRKWFRPLKQGFLIAFFSGMSGGLRTDGILSERKGFWQREYTPGQIMTVAATERNHIRTSTPDSSGLLRLMDREPP